MSNDDAQPGAPDARQAASRQSQTHVASLWLILRESCRAFSANNSMQTAATLAFYGFRSLMPLLLLCIYTLSVFMMSSDAILDGMKEATARIFPSFSDALLTDLFKLSRQKSLGVVSFAVVVWSMSPFTGAFRVAFARIFKAQKQMSYVKTTLFDMGTILALLAFLVLMVVGNMLYGILFPQATRLATVVKSFTLLVLTLGVLMTFARAFSPIRLRASLLFTGALVGTLLLAAMRPLFELMLRYNPSYGYAFGSLKAIFILVVWVYFTFAVLLFSTEVMAAAWRKDVLVLRGILSGVPRQSRATAILLERFVRECLPGEVLFHEGDPGGGMFYILTGSVDLTKGDRPLRTMGPGEYFGEMSMLLGAARTATAAAGADTRLVTIDQENFETILRENPQVVMALLKEMAERLKATSNQLRPK